jgi:hypothetical protein
VKKVLVFIIITFISLFLFAAPLYAFTTEGGETVSLTEDIEDDLYISGANVVITGDTDSDIICVGGRLQFDGDIGGDLMAAGGYITVNGNLGDDARIAGGIITINDGVGDDLIVVGGSITLSNSAKVEGDLVVSGGTININGEVVGKVIASGGEIDIDGKIGGDVIISDVSFLSVSEDSEIGGDLSYSSTQDATIKISKNAEISGEVKYTEVEEPEAVSEIDISKGVSAGIFGATYFGSKAISFLSLFVLGIILILAIPAVFNKFNKRMNSALGMCVGAGAITLFGVPVGIISLFIIAVFLFITVIGAGLGLLVILTNFILIILYAVLIYASTVFLSYFIGEKILSRTRLNLNKYGWKVLAYLIGLAIMVVAFSIPFAGWVFKLTGILFGLGGLTLIIKDWLPKFKKP